VGETGELETGDQGQRASRVDGDAVREQTGVERLDDGGRRALEVDDGDLSPGYLRPNGVPYSSRTVVKEFFDSFTLPEDGTWLIVTTVIADPDYLTQDFVLSSQFKKETNLSKWNPRPCDIPAPAVPARAPA